MKTTCALIAAFTFTAAAAEKEALVIGCATYTNATPLPLVKTDVTDVAAALRTLGFNVTPVTDPGIDAFNKAVLRFKAAAKGTRVVLVYYSGHGIEHDNINYLLPVDCTLDDDAQLRSQAVNVETLLTDLKATAAPAKTVILDCCRDNPFGKEVKSWAATKSAADANVLRELGEAEIPEATMVVFASSSGRKAAARLNKDSTHSPFTAAFLEFMKTPGLSLRDIFDKVEDDVTTATAGRQTPVVKFGGSSRIFRELVFLPGGGGPKPDSALAAKLAALEKKLAELENAGGASKAEAEALKKQLAALSVPPKAIPVPEMNGKGFTNTLGMKFVTVPSTTVQFCIHETRTRDYAAFMADTNRGYEMTGQAAEAWSNCSRARGGPEIPVGRGASGAEAAPATSTHPVICVSWLDATAFCEWLSRKEGNSYRLPTDAEWSIAAGLKEGRGTPQELHVATKNAYPWPGGKFAASSASGNYADQSAAQKFGEGWGIIEGCRTGWGLTTNQYRDGFVTTAPVMRFAANSHGLYDMGGNAWEWCADCFDGEDSAGKEKRLPHPRVLRGASWCNDDDARLLSSYRLALQAGERYDLIGFRVVLAVSGGG